MNSYLIKIANVGVAAALLVLVSCSSTKTVVSTDYVPIDYTQIKSFQWLAGEHERNKTVSDMAHQRIQENIETNIESKGFALKDSGADLLINYSVIAQDKVNIREYKVYDGFAPGFVWTKEHGTLLNKTREEYTETQVEEYFEGTLVVDVLNAKDNKIIWRGIGKKKIPEKNNKQGRDALIKEIVSSVLKTFPPEK